MSLHATWSRRVAECHYAVGTTLNDTLCPHPGAGDQTGSLFSKLPAALQVPSTLPSTDIDVLIRRNQHEKSRTPLLSRFLVPGWDSQLAPTPF